VKFGIFYEHQLPRPWTERSEYQLLHDALTQIELADRLGYDYAWLVEHHFLEEDSHCSAADVMPEFHAREAEHARWKADVLAGRVDLTADTTDTYKLYAHQNEDIVRLTPEELKAKMAAKEHQAR